jgi:hypothetical protein
MNDLLMDEDLEGLLLVVAPVERNSGDPWDHSWTFVIDTHYSSVPILLQMIVPFHLAHSSFGLHCFGMMCA